MTILNSSIDYDIILASQSPRRQELLKGLNIPFSIQVKSVKEHFPESLQKEEIPIYLAKLKSDAFSNELDERKLLITADTIVWLNNKVLGKPKDSADAKKMLNKLSGNKHTVYTGVCLKTKDKENCFWSGTDVYFRELSEEEITFYVDKYQPLDKAGSYGIQEWIGYVGIERIEGSYFNVMGLPVQKLYDELIKF